MSTIIKYFDAGLTDQLGEHVIHINDASQEHQLNLTLSNPTGEDITLEPLKGEPGEHNFHFALIFNETKVLETDPLPTLAASTAAPYGTSP